METHKNLYGETRKGSVETVEMREERPLLDKWTSQQMAFQLWT